MTDEPSSRSGVAPLRWIGSIDAAMPPVSPSRRRCFAPPVIRVDDALCGAARCRGIALWQRGIGAFKVIVVPALVDLQADRIGRVISLGPSRRRRQNRRNHQNRQSRNAHPSLFQDMQPIQDMRPTPEDKRAPGRAIPSRCAAPSAPSAAISPAFPPLVPFPVNSRSRVGAALYVRGAGEPLEWYDHNADNPPWIKALNERSRVSIS